MFRDHHLALLRAKPNPCRTEASHHKKQQVYHTHCLGGVVTIPPDTALLVLLSSIWLIISSYPLALIPLEYAGLHCLHQSEVGSFDIESI